MDLEASPVDYIDVQDIKSYTNLMIFMIIMFIFIGLVMMLFIMYGR